MAYNTERLKGLIIDKYGTRQAFCKAIGMRPSTLSKRLKDGRDWRGSSLIKAVRALQIPDEKIDYYFFDLRVEEPQPKGARK